MRTWGTKSSRHAGVPRRPRRRAFTLIETALATAIIGTGVVSMMGLMAACTRMNRTGVAITTAQLLAGNVQETMAGLSFNDPAYAATYFGPEPGETLASCDDVDDFDGKTFNPPVDALRQTVSSLAQYSQVVSVMPIYSTQLSSNPDPAAPTIPKTTYTGAARVLVKVLYRSQAGDTPQEVYRTSWVRVDQ